MFLKLVKKSDESFAIKLRSLVKTEKFYVAIFFFAGACMAAFSPATISRSSVGSGQPMLNLLLAKSVSFATILTKLRCLWLLVVILVVLRIRKGKVVKKFIKDNIELVLALGFGLAISYASGFDSARAAFGAELFALILALKGLSLFNLKKYSNHVGIISAVALTAWMSAVGYHSYLNHLETTSLVNQIKSGKSYQIITDEHDAGWLSQYVLPMIEPDRSRYAENYSTSYWTSHAIAAYYGRDSLCFIPKKLVARVASEPARFSSFEIPTDLPYYVANADSIGHFSKLEFVLKPTDFATLPFWRRPFAHRQEKYTLDKMDIDNPASVEINGGRYVIVKRHPDIDFRVKNINIIK